MKYKKQENAKEKKGHIYTHTHSPISPSPLFLPLLPHYPPLHLPLPPQYTQPSLPRRTRGGIVNHHATPSDITINVCQVVSCCAALTWRLAAGVNINGEASSGASHPIFLRARLRVRDAGESEAKSEGGLGE